MCEAPGLIALDNEHQALVEWLCPVDPSVIRRNIDKTRMPGTGIWFTKSDAFQRQSKYVESSCFWLNGISTFTCPSYARMTAGRLIVSVISKLASSRV